MLCQNCGKNEANVRYTQIINGVKKEGVVCESCAKKLGFESFDFRMPMHFQNLLGDFFENYEEDMLPSFIRDYNMNNKCEGEYENFIKTGLLTCPEAYDEFDARLEPILKKLQGSNQHIGRESKENESSVEKYKDEQKSNKMNQKEEYKGEKTEEEKNKNQMKTKEKLEIELKEAIRKERYEDAARIRDEIKKFQ